MANFQNNAITERGILLRSHVDMGAVFTATKIVMGSGYIPAGKTAKTITDVVTPVKELTINKKERSNDGKVIFGGAYTNEGIDTEFYFRELALYAKAVYPDGTEVDEVLYCYGNAEDSAELMAAYSTSTAVERQMDIVTFVGNEAQIDLTIQSGLYLSHAEKHAAGGEDPITPAMIGAINKNGDTMTGNFFVERASFPQIILRDTTQSRDGFFQYAENELLFIQNIPSNGDGYNRTILILGSENTNDEDVLRVAKIINGSWQTSKIYHENHKPTPDEIGAMLNGGYGVIASGTDIATLANKNGWYMLDARNTYVNVPEGMAGAWAVLEIRDKSATLQLLNGGRYFCNNLDIAVIAWHELATTSDLAAVVATAELV